MKTMYYSTRILKSKAKKTADSDMVNDTDRYTTCRSKFRAPPLQKITKNEGPSENMGFTYYPVEDFRPEF